MKDSAVNRRCSAQCHVTKSGTHHSQCRHHLPPVSPSSSPHNSSFTYIFSAWDGEASVHWGRREPRRLRPTPHWASMSGHVAPGHGGRVRSKYTCHGRVRKLYKFNYLGGPGMPPLRAITRDPRPSTPNTPVGMAGDLNSHGRHYFSPPGDLDRLQPCLCLIECPLKGSPALRSD